MIEVEIVFTKRDLPSILYVLDLEENHFSIVPFKCKKMSSEKGLYYLYDKRSIFYSKILLFTFAFQSRMYNSTTCPFLLSVSALFNGYTRPEVPTLL